MRTGHLALDSRPSERTSSWRHALAPAAVLVTLLGPVAAQAQFEERLQLPQHPDYTAAIALGDVDGDGDVDMVVGAFGQYPTPGRNRLFLNDGRGVFSDATTTHMPQIYDMTQSLALGDVDGDGDLDLIVGNSGQDYLYRNNGRGVFSDATFGSLPLWKADSTSVALGDVDGDGDLDLVVGRNRSLYRLMQNELYLNDGRGTFTGSYLPTASDYTHTVKLADVDLDGDLDLVVGNYVLNLLHLNDGKGRFTDATATNMPSVTGSYTSLALGDVDRDGDIDIIVGQGDVLVPANNQNRIFLNAGTGNFADATSSRMPSAMELTTSVALGDVDGDGYLDLICGNQGQPSRLYVNDGAGAFRTTPATRLPISGTPSELVLADVDRDNDLDLVMGISAQPDRLYLNLLRQLDAPLVLRVGQSFQIDVYARYGPARLADVAMPYISPASWSISLPPLGTLGIDPTVMVALTSFNVPQPAGVGSIKVQVPNSPSLAGLDVYTQALLLQNPLPARLTNTIKDTVLR